MPGRDDRAAAPKRCTSRTRPSSTSCTRPARCNDDAASSRPRPFDARRDGLVIGEGAGTFVLEDYEHAQARAARTIYAEILGFGTNCDGTHVTSPSSRRHGAAPCASRSRDARPRRRRASTMSTRTRTATEVGDIAESHATARRVRRARARSARSRATRATRSARAARSRRAFCIAMMREGWFAPNRNLDEVDPRCAPLDYMRGRAARSASRAS